jgi:uncharacterized paraquat-inducible protein A
MAICPECNKQELQAGESKCPHCSNKITDRWLKAIGAAGAVALAAVPMIVALIKRKDGTNT